MAFVDALAPSRSATAASASAEPACITVLIIVILLPFRETQPVPEYLNLIQQM